MLTWRTEPNWSQIHAMDWIGARKAGSEHVENRTKFASKLLARELILWNSDLRLNTVASSVGERDANLARSGDKEVRSEYWSTKSLVSTTCSTVDWTLTWSTPKFAFTVIIYKQQYNALVNVQWKSFQAQTRSLQIKRASRERKSKDYRLQIESICFCTQGETFRENPSKHSSSTRLSIVTEVRRTFRDHFSRTQSMKAPRER